MPIIALDIETLQQDPEPWMVPDVATMAPPATHKKPETIAAWRKEKAETILDELREKSSLEPLLGGIVLAIGIAIDDKPPTCILAKTGDEIGEAKALQILEAGLAKYPDHVLVTWNGTRFDLEFLRKRALRHGCYGLARRCFQDKPYGNPRHFDLFKVWQGHDHQALGKQRMVARLLGIESTDTVTGGQISDLYRSGLVDLVKQHVIEDVRVLREIYYRFRAAGWVVHDDVVPALPVRPCRVGPRDELLSLAGELQVATDKGKVQAAAEAAGIPWSTVGEPGEWGPTITDATTIEQIRKFVEGLQAKAQSVAA